jgi:KaiC/GvpD/RAD55 family RecA-like ATPase
MKSHLDALRKVADNTTSKAGDLTSDEAASSTEKGCTTILEAVDKMIEYNQAVIDSISV